MLIEIYKTQNIKKCNSCKEENNDFITLNCLDKNINICYECYHKNDVIEKKIDKYNLLIINSKEDKLCEICNKEKETLKRYIFKTNVNVSSINICNECLNNKLVLDLNYSSGSKIKNYYK